MLTTPQTKLSKTQFKCFNCRVLTPRKDGNWVNWNDMQVHLCPACDKATAQNKERAQDVS